MTPEERAAKLGVVFEVTGGAAADVHVEVWRGDLAAAIREAEEEARAAERNRCLGVVDAVERDGLSGSDGWDFYGEAACAKIRDRIREGGGT